ncbi:CpsD/CapB family tyrosine-protein kinase [Candidatus Omnitrophota bacterium]
MGRITDALKKVTDERVPRIQKKPAVQYVIREVEDTDIEQHIVSFHDPTSPIGEQYKILRTNIQALKFSKDYKTFLITSSVNKEGKTVTSANLAIAMAQEMNEKKVLLIDADMRKGTVGKYLGIDISPGLSEILSKKAELQNCLVNPGIDNFSVLPAGKAPHNPSELLNSKRMEQLIADLKKRFDYIFIDSPPIMPITDACIIGSMVDGVIVVIQAGRTQRDMIKHVQHRLFQAHANTLGFIVTNVEYHVPRSLYRYVHEYSTYDSYYKANKQDKRVNKKEEVANVV